MICSLFALLSLALGTFGLAPLLGCHRVAVGLTLAVGRGLVVVPLTHLRKGS